tara:strand:+ start:6411 stop:6851 length:441 start_codon:yes stop_codon:yes gene_type:complete
LKKGCVVLKTNLFLGNTLSFHFFFKENSYMKNSKGFTLIELIVVLVIIGVLCAIAYGSWFIVSGPYVWPGEREQIAKQLLVRHVHEQGMEHIGGLECDADDDEYSEVDCEIEVRKPNGEEKWYYANCYHDKGYCEADPRLFGIFGD